MADLLEVARTMASWPGRVWRCEAMWLGALVLVPRLRRHPVLAGWFPVVGCVGGHHLSFMIAVNCFAWGQSLAW
jgi:hypothetical protein